MSKLSLAIKAFLFDLDGVILNSEPLHDEALLATCRHFGFDSERVPLLHYKGWTEPAVAADVLQKHACSSVSVQEFVQFKDRTYVELSATHLKLVEGAADFLRKSRVMGFRLGLVTSALRSNATGPLKRFGLEDCFEFLVTGEDVKNGKPHPEPYETGVRNLGLCAANIAVVEDAVNGIRSAKSAGCLGIGLTTSFSAAELVHAGADFAVNSYSELQRYFHN